MPENSISAPVKYAQMKGNANIVYDAICKTLSARQNQVAWQHFGNDEWQLLVLMAVSEGVSPLLFWHLKDQGWPSETPKEVEKALGEAYYTTTAQNIVLFQELARILTALEEAEIPVTVLKGAAFAQTLYPEPGLRPMNDLDLLIHPDFLGKTLKLLKKLGFELWNITYHAMLVGGDHHKITLELHWSIIPSSIVIEKSSMKVTNFMNSLSSDYFSTHLVYSSAHLFYQHWTSARLLWGYDIYLLLNKSLCGEVINQLSSLLEWQDAVFSSLFWVIKIFGIEWPSFIKKPNQAEIEHVKLYMSSIEQFTTRNNWSKQVFKTLSLKTKCSWILGTLFPSVAYIKWTYKPKPTWIWPIYYLHRWLKIANELIKNS